MGFFFITSEGPRENDLMRSTETHLRNPMAQKSKSSVPSEIGAALESAVCAGVKPKEWARRVIVFLAGAFFCSVFSEKSAETFFQAKIYKIYL